MRQISLFMLGAAALSLAACGGEKSAETEETAETAAESTGELVSEETEAAPSAEELAKTAAENAVASEKFLEENAKKEGVKVAENGLQYLVLEEGDKSRAAPEEGELVDVRFVASTMDGVEFDSSLARGIDVARFKLDPTMDNAGWLEGLTLMQPGDRFRFFIPPELAYGEAGAPPRIGPNEVVIFEIGLVRVVSPERNLAAAETFLTENGAKDGVKTTDSGLQYEVISEGDGNGASPTAADVVRVHYKGTLVDGTEFDSSIARGEPAEFPLGRVIAGWTEGLQLMKAGDKYRFFVPPGLGYGEAGTPGGPIGPNEALIFEVELLEVK